MGKCAAPDCKREEPDHEFAIRVGLEKRDESTKDHAIRCLTYMFQLHGKEMTGVAAELAKAADIEVPEPIIRDKVPIVRDERDDWLASVGPAPTDPDDREADIPKV